MKVQDNDGNFRALNDGQNGGRQRVRSDVKENQIDILLPERVAGIDLNQTDLPDPLARTLEQMVDRIHALEEEIESLKKALKEASRT